MAVSVVIPNYNGEKYIEKCLQSLIIQSMTPEEIIIIDNNSSDNSIDIIENFIDKTQQNNIRLIKLTNNGGFSVAVNEGIRINKSKFVILLNNDTELHKDFISELYGAIITDNNIFACSSKMIRYTERDIIDDAGDGYTIFGWATKHGDGKNQKLYSDSKEVFSACAGAAIYRSKVFNEIGLFDENFFAYLEDLDISYRARIHGYKNMYAPNAVVYHIGSATSGSRHNQFKVKLASRNNIYLLHKNMPMYQLIINFPFLFFGIIIKMIYFLMKGLGKAYITGIFEGIKNTNNIHKVLLKNNFYNYLKIEGFLIKDTIKLLRRV